MQSNYLKLLLMLKGCFQTLLKKFFDDTTKKLNVAGLAFERDNNFDDQSGKMRGAGIKAVYSSFFSGNESLKSGVILELG